MTTTFVITNGNGALTIKYTAPTAQISAVLNDAVHSLFDRGFGDHGTDDTPILFPALSVAQKAAILDEYVKGMLVNLAADYKSNSDQAAARAAADATKGTNYGLG